MNIGDKVRSKRNHGYVVEVLFPDSDIWPGTFVARTPMGTEFHCLKSDYEPVLASDPVRVATERRVERFVKHGGPV